MSYWPGVGPPEPGIDSFLRSSAGSRAAASARPTTTSPARTGAGPRRRCRCSCSGPPGARTRRSRLATIDQVPAAAAMTPLRFISARIPPATSTSATAIATLNRRSTCCSARQRSRRIRCSTEAVNRCRGRGRRARREDRLEPPGGRQRRRALRAALEVRPHSRRPARDRPAAIGSTSSSAHLARHARSSRRRRLARYRWVFTVPIGMSSASASASYWMPSR